VNNHLKKVELAANISIILLAVMTGVTLYKTHLSADPPKNANPTISGSGITKPSTFIGSKVNLSGVNWKVNGQTVLLALSTTCHFCSESTPFYRQLLKERGSIHIIAVLPQTVDAARKYLEQHGVTVDDVRQAQLDSIDVQATPTLLLVNDAGVITSSWVGKLAADKEAEVLSKLRTPVGD
jgi:hypothetical protein